MGLFSSKPPQYVLSRTKTALKQLNESAKLVNTTVKPDVFFSRYNFIFDLLLELRQYEKYMIFSGTSPSSDYFNTISKMEATVNDFLDRAVADRKCKLANLKTEKAKESNREKFAKEIKYAFDNCHSFWSGSTLAEHYTGNLYTSRNYQRAIHIADELSLPATPLTNAATGTITTSDMEQFTMMPYQLNCKVFNKPSENPSSYINLNARNRNIAVEQLRIIDEYIRQSPQLSRLVPSGIHIPIEQMIYSRIGSYSEYTRLICTPYTKTGKISKFPLYLYFTTDPSQTDNETHGKLYYGKDGNILKANVSIWMHNQGYFYSFKTVGRTFFLSEIKSTVKRDKNDLPAVIYEFDPNT